MARSAERTWLKGFRSSSLFSFVIFVVQKPFSGLERSSSIIAAIGMEDQILSLPANIANKREYNTEGC